MSDAVTTAPGTPPIIRVEGVNKWYDSFQVLTDINLSVRPGERIVDFQGHRALASPR